MTKSGPSKNPSFKKSHFTISKPQKRKENHSPVRKRLPQLPAQTALSSAFIIKTHSEKLGFGLGPDLTIIGS
jgi:hypothetical protein